MVFKLAPPYLCDLCPDFVYERSCYSLCLANNLCLPYVHTDRHKKSFLKMVEQSSVKDTHIVLSRHFQAQPFKILVFSIP